MAAPPPDPVLVSAQTHASKHRAELQSSAACGCYFCFRLFPFGDIAKWIDNKQTALCPKCGIDAVLGSSSGYMINDTFLRRMHRQWFGSTAKSRYP